MKVIEISRMERLIARGLMAALAVFAVVCIFWTPFDRLKLLRPIPANAVLVTSHRNLGARLENMATNIFLKAFFDSGGTLLESLRRDHYVARILASRLVMAYVPAAGQPVASATWSPGSLLAISAWVGGWTPLLRWALWIFPPDDIAPLCEYNGHRLWAYKKPVRFFGRANYLSFAIDEGVFIGCLSPDRNDIAHLLRVYDGQAESISSIAQTRLIESTPVMDQAWLRFDLPYPARNKSVFAVCSLDVLRNDYLAATVRFEADICPASGTACAGDYRLPRSGFAGKIHALSPSIVARFPSAMVLEGLDKLVPPAWTMAARPIVTPSSGTNNVCYLAVLTGAYGGKVGKEPFKMVVPTILLAVSGSRPEQSKAAVVNLLDFINTRHRFGLMLNPDLPPAGQCRVFAIESTSGALLNYWSGEDQPAFAFCDDWFLLASNGAGLRKLLLNFQSPAVPAGDGGNAWLRQADNGRAEAFIWMDPDEGGKALRFALITSIIILNTDDRDPSNQNAIKVLKVVRSWLENISNLKTCMVRLESENGKAVVRLEIGRK